jgi:hypothetical protein
MSLWLRQSRKGAGGRGEDPLYSDLLDPARLNLAAVGVQQGRLLAPENQHEDSPERPIRAVPDGVSFGAAGSLRPHPSVQGGGGLLGWPA